MSLNHSSPTGPVASRRRFLHGRFTSSALLIAAALFSFIVVVVLHVHDAGLSVHLGPLHLRVKDVSRVLVAGAVIHVAMVVACWPTRGTRRLALGMAGAFVLCALLVTASRTAPFWSVGDAAIIELYTINASRGEQLLGAYSQFGWHHPGPLMFYALAPFYVAGGRGIGAVRAGALAVNLISLSAIAWGVRRGVRSGASWSGPMALAILLVVFLIRGREILASAWNPHISVFPFLALLILSASAASGDFVALPLAALFASFVAQSHIGLAPVSGVLLAGALTGAVMVAREHPELRRSLRSWVKASAYVLAAAWLLPLSEQIAHSPGNMTLIWRFFTGGRTGQPVLTASRAFADMLAGVFRPGFRVATGWRYVPSSHVLPLLAAMAEIAALGLAARRNWRAQDRFGCALASLCLVASIAALASVTRIHGDIVDHEIFWIAALGVVNAAVIAGLVLPVQRPPIVPESLPASLMTITWLSLVAAGVALGFFELRDVENRSHMFRDELATRTLSDQIRSDMATLEIAKPVIRTDVDGWSVAAGVVLSFKKRETPFSVSPDLVGLFDRQLLPNGDEDAEITVCGSSVHQRLIERSNNVVVGQYETIFADAVKLPPH